jgi:hypothetical protein
MAVTRAGAIMAAAKAVSKSCEIEKKRKSTARVNGVNANQRSDEVRYGRPIEQGMQRAYRETHMVVRGATK